MKMMPATYHDHDDSMQTTTFDTTIGNDYGDNYKDFGDGKEGDDDYDDYDDAYENENDDNGRRRMMTIIEHRQRCRNRKRCTIFVLMVYIAVAIYYWYCNSFLSSK